MNADYTHANIIMNRWRDPKLMVKVIFPKGDGYKTRAQRLLRDGLKCYYSHRLGYVASPAKFAKFERLYAEGWDACVMTGALQAPTEYRARGAADPRHGARPLPALEGKRNNIKALTDPATNSIDLVNQTDGAALKDRLGWSGAGARGRRPLVASRSPTSAAEALDSS